MEHLDVPLGNMHRAHNWEYADAAARTAATITDVSLLYRLALQLDDKSLWMLVDVDPAVWESKSGVDYSASTGSNSVGHISAGTGATDTTVRNKLRQILSPLDLGAVGDGTTSDTTPMTNLKAHAETFPTALLNFAGGRYATSGTFWTNHVSPTSMAFDKPSVFGVMDGTAAAPNTVDNDPAMWVQKYTAYDNGTDRYAHNPGAVYGLTYIQGSGTTGSTNTDGTWIGILGNTVMNGVNRGSSVAPDYDAQGNVIGVAGFARLNGYPGDGNIACGVWGYAEGPTMDATTYANLPATNWSLVGFEANVQINHPEGTFQDLLVGKGSSAGMLIKNYRTPGTGVRNWTFGIVFDGNPSDDNYSGANSSLWNSMHTGILIDKFVRRGILFGKYVGSVGVGIEFPTSWTGFTNRMKAAISIGDNCINMGQYTESTFNDGDFWLNTGKLYYRYNSVSDVVVAEHSGVARMDGVLHVGVTGTPVLTGGSGGNASFGSVRVGASADVVLRTQHSVAGVVTVQRSNNSSGTAAAVVASDLLGGFYLGGYDGSAYSNNAALQGFAAETHTGSARGAYMTFGTTAIGSTTRTERLRINTDGALVHAANANTIVDANSHIGLRSYTVGTLPSAATVARLIYVSNGTTNKRLAVSDGTNWRWPDGVIVS